MRVTTARLAAELALDELDQQVHDALEHVSVYVVDQTPPGIRSDAKGYFQGQQQCYDPEDDDDDSDAGEWYDYDEHLELEVVSVGGGRPAVGEIILVASNIADPQELEHALYHEIAHALGESEDEVAELGLE